MGGRGYRMVSVCGEIRVVEEDQRSWEVGDIGWCVCGGEMRAVVGGRGYRMVCVWGDEGRKGRSEIRWTLCNIYMINYQKVP